MKKMMIAAICLVVAGFITVMISLISIGFNFAKLGTVKLKESIYNTEEKFDSLIIDCKYADFKLLPSQDGENKVVFVDSEDAEHTVSVTDGVLTVKGQESSKRKWYENIQIWSGNTSAKMYLKEGDYDSAEIKLSAGDLSLSKGYTFRELDIEDVSGDMKIASCIENKLRIKNISGDIELSGIECEEIRIESVSGDIELNGVTAKRIKIKNTSGDIELINCDGDDVDLYTTSGDIEAELLSGKAFALSTTSGEIKAPPSTSCGNFKAKTVSGDIEIEIA